METVRGNRGSAKLDVLGTTKNVYNPSGGGNVPVNPIPAMLTESRVSFKRYQGETFDDVPIIEPIEE